MSTRILFVAVTATTLAAFVLMRDTGGGPPLAPAAPRARSGRDMRTSTARPTAPARNVFEYAGRAPVDSLRPPATLALEAPPVVVPPVAPSIRLLGLVRRGGALQAALLVHGESVTVGVGETVKGYTVAAIDEDSVRLRASDGTVLTLPAGGP